MSETRANSDKFMLRLPDGMREQIKEIADKNGRSMNAEIVEALSVWVDGLAFLKIEQLDREITHCQERVETLDSIIKAVSGGLANQIMDFRIERSRLSELLDQLEGVARDRRA